MDPWPGTYTFWQRKDDNYLRLILRRVAVAAEPEQDVAPGTVLEAVGDRLVVAAGEGAVLLQGIQPSGKRPLSTEQFLRGYRVQVGDRFGPEGESTAGSG